MRGVPANVVIARIPAIVEIRAQHAALMKQPMIGTVMVGDPRLVGPASSLPWRISQYAAAMLARRGEIGVDASGLDARFEAPSTVVFTLRADDELGPNGRTVRKRPIEIARFTVPDHVMGFQPCRDGDHPSDFRGRGPSPRCAGWLR